MNRALFPSTEVGFLKISQEMKGVGMAKDWVYRLMNDKVAQSLLRKVPKLDDRVLQTRRLPINSSSPCLN